MELINKSLTGTEGARLLENANAFPSCAGKFEEVFKCPAGCCGPGETPQGLSAEAGQAHHTARGKRASWSASQQLHYLQQCL